MFDSLLFIHSAFRWLVLISMLYAIYRAYTGYASNAEFTPLDNAVRHWTATIAHIQLVLGVIVYIKSPLVQYLWANFQEGLKFSDAVFFGIIHIVLMLIAVIMLTIGSALAKRKSVSQEQFKTMLIWFTIALLIILIAIPWPFSPLAGRPYFRYPVL